MKLVLAFRNFTNAHNNQKIMSGRSINFKPACRKTENQEEKGSLPHRDRNAS